MTIQFDPTQMAGAVRTAITSDQMIYVADSSNIEARMLAWEANQPDLLDVFRGGGDVYAYTAQDIYNRPIDKKKDPHERFVGKVTALGLGYGMGWVKFQRTMAAGALGGPPVFLSDAEAQHIVNTFRTKRFAIKAYWAEAEQAITDMYMGNVRQWGVLATHRNCLVMPNGMALQYPGLRPSEADELGRVGWEYHNGKFWTKIYSGKLVENITQALARIVLFDQMRLINKLFTPLGGRVVLNVHDEVIAVGPSFGARLLGHDDDGKEVWDRDGQAQDLFNQMLTLMRTPSAWCMDLPLDGEGGMSFSYNK